MLGETLDFFAPRFFDWHPPAAKDICSIRFLPASAAPVSIPTRSRPCAPRIAAAFSAKQSVTIIGRRKFRLRSFIRCAGIRCGCSRLSIVPYYYGAKKIYLDWVASRQLATGHYDLFHSWSGDCLETLRVAKRMRIPSMIEIPTWHRDGGKSRTAEVGECIKREKKRYQRWKAGLLLKRERFIEEYELADLLIVLSETAADTFRVQGFPEEKLFYLPRGVDVDRFKPGRGPPNSGRFSPARSSNAKAFIICSRHGIGSISKMPNCGWSAPCTTKRSRT